jgi:hypothetical protein
MSRKFLKPIPDQFMRGLIGGLIAGTVKDIPDVVLVDLFKIKHLAFWDYVGEMILNQIPKSIFEHFIAFTLQVAFSLGLGIIYSTIVIPGFPTKHYLVRGAIYGSACWFVLMSIIKLFHITPLFAHNLRTPLLTMLFSAGYGLLLAVLDRYFSPQKQKSSKNN